MKIALLGPISTQDFFSFIKKRDIKSLPKGHGSSFVSQLAIGLLELGHKVSVITLSDDITDNKIVVYKNKKFNIYYCPLRKRAFRLSGFLVGRAADFFYREIRYMRQAITQDNPDIINAHWAYEYAFAAITSKKKYVLTNHDIPHVILKYNLNLYRLVRFIMGCITLRIAKKITTPSMYAKLQTKKYTNRPISIIPNCLNKDLINSKIKNKETNKKMKIVMINNGFDRRKNLKTALKAFKEFNKNFPYSTLCLFGNAMEQEGPCYKWAKKNNLDNNVYFYGLVYQIDLMKVLHKYDILLHTALEETFGNIFLEAMIKGVPIIAGKNSGAAPEVIKNNGILVDVSNIEQLVYGLNKYTQNPNFWKKIRYKAYYYVKNKYSNKKIVKKYLDLYKKTLNNKN